MTTVVESHLIGILFRLWPCQRRDKGALGKDEEGQGARNLLRNICELGQMVSQGPLVLRPRASEEDEIEPLHSGANKGYPLEAVFEDDVKVSMEFTVVADDPKVQPVRVDLVVGDPDAPLWQVKAGEIPLPVEFNVGCRVENIAVLVSEVQDEFGWREEPDHAYEAFTKRPLCPLVDPPSDELGLRQEAEGLQ